MAWSLFLIRKTISQKWVQQTLLMFLMELSSLLVHVSTSWKRSGMHLVYTVGNLDQMHQCSLSTCGHTYRNFSLHWFLFSLHWNNVIYNLQINQPQIIFYKSVKTFIVYSPFHFPMPTSFCLPYAQPTHQVYLALLRLLSLWCEWWRVSSRANV